MQLTFSISERNELKNSDEDFICLYERSYDPTKNISMFTSFVLLFRMLGSWYTFSTTLSGGMILVIRVSREREREKVVQLLVLVPTFSNLRLCERESCKYYYRTRIVKLVTI